MATHSSLTAEISFTSTIATTTTTTTTKTNTNTNTKDDGKATVREPSQRSVISNIRM